MILHLNQNKPDNHAKGVAKFLLKIDREIVKTINHSINKSKLMKINKV